MIAPDLALQGAIVTRLKTNAAVHALIGDRFYDAVPQNVDPPYGNLGEFQVLDDGADCFDDSVEIYVTLHTWSRPSSRPKDQGGPAGTVEAKAINSAIARALNRAALDLGPDWVLVELAFRDSRTFTDADGRTVHGVVTLRAMIDPA